MQDAAEIADFALIADAVAIQVAGKTARGAVAADCCHAARIIAESLAGRTADFRSIGLRQALAGTADIVAADLPRRATCAVAADPGTRRLGVGAGSGAGRPG